MDLQAGFQAIPSVKVMINVGALLDIPTGTYLRGKHGESILNGGLGFLTGVVGIGNNFKSTIMHYQFMTAMARMGSKSTGNTYDTEINIHEWHLKQFMNRIEELNGEDIIDNGRWVITDKTIYHADEWYDILKEYMVNKRKNAKSIMRDTPFLDRNKTSLLKIIQPTFTEVDSLSEFVTQDVIRMQDDNSLGDSGANTMSMRQGLQKNRFLMETPGLAGGTYNYILMAAHIGDEFNMDPRAPVKKKLQHLPQGVKLKGVPEKFTFVMNNCWHCYNASPLRNDTTKAPEYPRHSDDALKMDTDLSSVIIRQLRSKSGPSGMATELVVSQQEGVLPSLTEFHYIKSRRGVAGYDRFGIEGTQQNYVLELYPECKLSRSVVRGKIDSDARLRRALNITSELCQMKELWHDMEEGLWCTPKELYADLKARGYDWNVLLDTRGWWTLDNDQHPIPFLSTMDLLRMRKGLYHPYWMKNDPAANPKASKAKPTDVKKSDLKLPPLVADVTVAPAEDMEKFLLEATAE